MSVPTTRSQFKDWCLRQLGRGVLKVNVSDEQVDDRVDQALTYFADYHFEGTTKQYYRYQTQDADFANRYITLPDEIIGAVRIFDISSFFGSQSLFSIRYQVAMSDVYSFASVSMIPYWMCFQNIAFMEQILVGQQPVRYNRYDGNKLYVDMDWTRLTVGDYLVVECYQLVDPDASPGIWSDRWLGRYTAALIKEQWGTNLKLYSGMKMPGGTEFNGQKIYDEAVAEVAALEDEMKRSWSLPTLDMIG